MKKIPGVWSGQALRPENLPRTYKIHIFGKTLYSWFSELKEPDRTNLQQSITPEVRNYIMPSLLSAICLLSWRNGFAPVEYYEYVFKKYENEEKRA